jgi:hypothetical protein
MKGIIRLKGGSGSGNFGHLGRPGEVGGSSSAQSDLDITAYASKKYDALRSKGAYKRALNRVAEVWRQRYPDKSDDDINKAADQIVSAMDLGEKEFDWYNTKYDLGFSDAQKKDFIKYSEYVQRAVDRTIFKVHDKLTYHNPDNDFAIPNVDGASEWYANVSAARVGLVGNNVQDAVGEINKFGITVGIPEGWENEPALHTALSNLVHVLNNEPVVADVASRNLRRIRFDAWSGDTFLARAMGDSIDVNLSSSWIDNKFFGTGPGTWVHEIGHISENDIPYSSWHNLFTSGNRASSYSWKSPSESYAESFTAYIANREAFEDWMPDKIKFFDDLYGGVK